MRRPTTEVSNGLTAVLASLVIGTGCESAQTKACTRGYAAAQQTVLAVDAKSDLSVGGALREVETTLAACRAAERHEEVEQLTRARNELAAQASLLERRARRGSRGKPTADELARLAKDGDPTCPRGQAYRPPRGQEIRCSGPQLLEMNRAQVREYFEQRDYTVRQGPGNELEIERGSERFRFVYPPAPEAAPSCLALVPAPGIPWQEALARASGANPARLKTEGTLRTAHGTLPYSVDEKQVTIRIGECKR